MAIISSTPVKYNEWQKRQLDGGTDVVDWNTDSIKVMLVTSAYVPTVSEIYLSDDAGLRANEVANGNGYVTDGLDLTGVTIVEAAGVATVDANDLVWSQNALGFTDARYAILYKDTGVDGTSILISYMDFTSDVGNQGADLTLSWNVSGIFTQV